MSPLCESYLPPESVDAPEVFYPLNVLLCEECLLVQLPMYVTGEDIFSEYAYFSSYSDSWVAHAKRYADEMIGTLGLTPRSLVTEVASNDGYLLQHFASAGIPVLGVEPAGNVAEAAIAKGIRTVVKFLGPETGAAIAAEYGQADLVAANNVFAHVPDIRGFAAGLRALVKDSGLVTLEFPHLLRLIERRQYDTIYHEHFSYLSLLTASRALADRRPAGGGCRGAEHARWLASGPCPACRGGRRAIGTGEGRAWTRRKPPACIPSPGTRGSPARCSASRSDLLTFLIGAADEGKTVAGYGAPGKGNTLLNHCGIRSDLLQYTVDRSPVKQGKYLPGYAHPHLRRRIALRRRGRTTSSSCRGISVRRSARNSTTSARGAAAWSFRSPH